ncbi:MAG: hypothetical protein E4G95_08640, partial [Bacteroidia bacterium]
MKKNFHIFTLIHKIHPYKNGNLHLRDTYNVIVYSLLLFTRLSRIQHISWIHLVCFTSVAGIIVFSIIGYPVPVVLFALVITAMIVLLSLKTRDRDNAHAMESQEFIKVLEKR